MDLYIWQFIRASGLLASLLLTFSVLAGILVKTRAADLLFKRAWVYEAHQSLSIAALGLTALHIGLVMLNSHVPFSPAAAFIPFVASWQPPAVALGIVAFYLMASLVVSSYARGLIGQKAWRALHFASFLAWFAALMHGITAGSDTALPAVQWLYWLSAGSVVMATVYRILLPSPPKPAPPAAVASSASR